MHIRKFVPAAALLAVPLALPAQSPVAPLSKLQRGLESLSQGSWAQALGEWNQDGLLAGEALEETRATLEKLVPQPRTYGGWAPLRAPIQQRLWQRHWVLATFDRGAVFAVFDYVHHRGEWRLLRVAAAQDPGEILRVLDTSGALKERN